jgi:hypothetical protein
MAGAVPGTGRRGASDRSDSRAATKTRTINASDHTCRIPDAVRDFSATPALVTLARGAVRGFTLFVHSGCRNGVASSSRLQPPTLRMYSFLMGVR